jgi:hypothetical protein
LEWGNATINEINIVSAKQEIPLPVCDFSVPDFQAGKVGTLQLFIGIEVQYRDIFDTALTHRTQRALKLLTDTQNVRFAYVGPHNCTDDDCPK